MRELLKLKKYFYKYRGRLVLGGIFVLASNLFAILQPRMIGNALDYLYENLTTYQEMPEGVEKQAIFQDLSQQLLYFGMKVIGLALLMGIFMYFMRQTIIVVSRLIENDMRRDLYDHYQALDQGFYRRNSTGDLMARITEDVNKVRMFIGPAIMYSINLTFLFIFAISSMLMVSPELTFYSMLPLPLLSVLIYVISNRINKKSTIIQQHLAGLNSLAQEVYSGIKVVKSYAQEPAMGRHFEAESNIYRKVSLDLARIQAFFFPLMVLLIGASTVLTVYIGGLKVIDGSLTPGKIAEFVIYVSMLTWPVTAIGWIASLTQQAAASQKRINEFMDNKPAITNPTEKSIPLKGHVRFENVSFTYPDTGVTALRQISFEVLPGQKIGIIGRTGSGKTTIADLIERMYDATEGQITIDGHDIKTINLDDIRQMIGYVPQDSFLFSTTIEKNISFGTPDASLEVVKNIARAASVYEDIDELPQGFQTMVGERGVTLSGGQKQRVSLARALIKSPTIVLLDDSLSAVDTKTEQEIVQYLNELLHPASDVANKSAIVITHRLSALPDMDKIIVLEDGRIIEEGSHDELMNHGGYYAEQYEAQSSESLES